MAAVSRGENRSGSKQLQKDPHHGDPGGLPLPRQSGSPTPPIVPAPARGHKVKGHRSQGWCIPNVAVLLNGSIGWISPAAVTAGTELRRHTALARPGQRPGAKGCLRGQCPAHSFRQPGEQGSALCSSPQTYQQHGASPVLPGGQEWLALGLSQVRRQAPGT